MLYFAYGSNMNLAQMRRRCPGAHFCGRGVLHDYRLVERCFADIEEATGASVHGAVFEITSPELLPMRLLRKSSRFPVFSVRLIRLNSSPAGKPSNSSGSVNLPDGLSKAGRFSVF